MPAFKYPAPRLTPTTCPVVVEGLDDDKTTLGEVAKSVGVSTVSLRNWAARGQYRPGTLHHLVYLATARRKDRRAQRRQLRTKPAILRTKGL